MPSRTKPVSITFEPTAASARLTSSSSEATAGWWPSKSSSPAPPRPRRPSPPMARGAPVSRSARRCRHHHRTSRLPAPRRNRRHTRGPADDLGPSCDGRGCGCPRLRIVPHALRHHAFNGRPGSYDLFCWRADTLQWRAGQLPGRTGSLGVPRWRSRTFNGGPGNCPAELARHQTRARLTHLAMPSMEGRAIARPNKRWGSPIARLRVHLQWRAGQLPGRTIRCVSGRPSMEGRAIARPNPLAVVRVVGR